MKGSHILNNASRISSISNSLLAATLTVAVASSAVSLLPPVRAAEAQESAAAAASQLTSEQLDELVGPIALYPDELVGIVLPASTYPLQIVQAARYLDKRKSQTGLEPDKNWDSSVLGLLNYPEVIDKMNNDLDWTSALGSAVLNQQQGVMDAIQQFRNKTYTAGNLQSTKQTVIIQEKEIIKIESASPDVIYVPSYNPATVIVTSPAPYSYVYSTPYPYYYSPAATFWTGMFVGAAIGYGVGWHGHGHGHHDINVNRSVNISGNNVKWGGGNSWNSNIRTGGQVGRPGTRPSTGQRPGTGQRASTGQRAVNQSGRSSSGSFGGYERGQTSTRNSQRGQQSRASSSSSRTSRSSGSRSFGGGGRSGGRRR